MVAGDLTTGWRHSAAEAIVQTVKGATDLRMLTEPRLLPTRCRPFRQVRVPVVVRDHGEVRAGRDLITGQYRENRVWPVTPRRAEIPFVFWVHPTKRTSW
jgi:hypothetical protein